jgi:hypothetical protein
MGESRGEVKASTRSQGTAGTSCPQPLPPISALHRPPLSLQSAKSCIPQATANQVYVLILPPCKLER